MRQNRFYSTIYILATGLSITMVMVLAIIIYLKVADIPPETGRNRLLILKSGQTTVKDSNGQSYLSLDVIRRCVYHLEEAEAVAAVYNDWGDHFAQPAGSAEQVQVKVKYTDAGFWNVFSFSFTGGKPFGEADMQSGMQVAVISESLARQLLGTADATGQYINLDMEPYRVCGVVKDVSFITNHAYAQLWIPYTAYADMEPVWAEETYGNTLGGFTGYALAPSTSDVRKVKEEIDGNIKRFASSLGEGFKFTVNGQPDRQWQSLFRVNNGREIDFTKILLQYGLIFLTFLIIPAVSLSGMADSQMERRLAEMGVRRAFGARRGGLMRQLLAENFLFTFLGSLLGLVISYLLVWLFRGWILNVGMNIDAPSGDVMIAPSMLINYEVFGISVVICLLLNLMVTVIPAWQAAGKDIIYSLNNK